MNDTNLCRVCLIGLTFALCIRRFHLIVNSLVQHLMDRKIWLNWLNWKARGTVTKKRWFSLCTLKDFFKKLVLSQFSVGHLFTCQTIRRIVIEQKKEPALTARSLVYRLSRAQVFTVLPRDPQRLSWERVDCLIPSFPGCQIWTISTTAALSHCVFEAVEMVGVLSQQGGLSTDVTNTLYL